MFHWRIIVRNIVERLKMKIWGMEYLNWKRNNSLIGNVKVQGIIIRWLGWYAGYSNWRRELKKKNWTIERIIYVILKLPKKYGKGSIGE